jgi:hypothetical protein
MDASESNTTSVRLCRKKRLKNELRLYGSVAPVLVRSENSEYVFSIESSDILLECPESYPFDPPIVRNAPRIVPIEDYWLWFGTIFLRPKNRLHYPSFKHCLCCTSPTCDWNPRRRLRDVVDHIVCLQDAAHVVRHRRMYRDLFTQYCIPFELVEKIAELA